MSKVLINSKTVRDAFGGISSMTLWRYLNDNDLDFPKPTIIRNRRYWSAESIEAFKERMAAVGVSKSA